MTGHSIRVFSVVIVLCWACSTPVPPPHGVLSDEELQAYGTSRYDKREFMSKTLELGTHRNTTILVEFPCSDICPDYTVRVIHYVIPQGKTCSEIGGIVRKFKVPAGPAMHFEEFCFPEPIVKVWSRYVHASGLPSLIPWQW